MLQLYPPETIHNVDSCLEQTEEGEQPVDHGDADTLRQTCMQSLHYLIYVEDDVGGGLINLEDFEASLDVGLLEFELGKLLPHGGDELKCLCHWDGCREGTLALKLLGKI